MCRKKKLSLGQDDMYLKNSKKNLLRTNFILNFETYYSKDIIKYRNVK